MRIKDSLTHVRNRLSGRDHSFQFKAVAPDLKKYVGQTITIPDVGRVKIKSIVGNRTRPAFYEINGEHLIGMLRFHAQVIGDKSITEEQFLAFESMEMQSEKMPQPTLIDKKGTLNG